MRANNSVNGSEKQSAVSSRELILPRKDRMNSKILNMISDKLRASVILNCMNGKTKGKAAKKKLLYLPGLRRIRGIVSKISD